MANEANNKKVYYYIGDNYSQLIDHFTDYARALTAYLLYKQANPKTKFELRKVTNEIMHIEGLF